MTSSLAARRDYRVADLSLAPFGRKEIHLAEHEMPGLRALRKEFGPSKPLAGARISGSPDRARIFSRMTTTSAAAIGIDFGTTNSSIGRVNSSGGVEIGRAHV